jgi:hypothetical protein
MFGAAKPIPCRGAARAERRREMTTNTRAARANKEALPFLMKAVEAAEKMKATMGKLRGVMKYKLVTKRDGKETVFER